MLHYIIQLILFQAAFLLVYEGWLKKETFFNYNRGYLLIAPIVAILLPFLKLRILQNAFPADTLIMLPEVILGASKETSSSGSVWEVIEAGNQVNWWVIAYAAGFAVSLSIFVGKFHKVWKLLKFGVVSESDNRKIIEVPDSYVACTFYNTIFLGDQIDDTEREQILSHEMVHVDQRHTLDLLFFELLKIVLWFNPLVYIYQSRISTLHEFIADAGVVEKVEKQLYFQQLLNSAFNTRNISFINQFFNHSIIKKRIVMLQKSRSKSTSKFKFLIILPLMLAMLAYVSCSEDPTDTQEEQEAMAQEKLEEIKAIISDGTEFTAEDKERVAEILGTISKKDIDKAVQGEQSVSLQKMNNITSNDGDIPFAVIEEVPIFPGCEDLSSNEERKECMSQKITEFVSANFNTGLGKELKLEGLNRVYVQFRINTDGEVEGVKARAPHPALKEEAMRVVSELPQMVPGKQDGKEIAVLYTLPISFMVEE